MGLFDKLFGKDAIPIKVEDLVVTQAVDPTKISQDKKAEDLKKLGKLEGVLSQSNSSSNLAQNVKAVSVEEEGMQIKNPFVGE